MKKRSKKKSSNNLFSNRNLIIALVILVIIILIPKGGITGNVTNDAESDGGFIDTLIDFFTGGESFDDLFSAFLVDEEDEEFHLCCDNRDECTRPELDNAIKTCLRNQEGGQKYHEDCGDSGICLIDCLEDSHCGNGEFCCNKDAFGENGCTGFQAGRCFADPDAPTDEGNNDESENTDDGKRCCVAVYTERQDFPCDIITDEQTCLNAEAGNVASDTCGWDENTFTCFNNEAKLCENSMPQDCDQIIWHPTDGSLSGVSPTDSVDISELDIPDDCGSDIHIEYCGHGVTDACEEYIELGFNIAAMTEGTCNAVTLDSTACYLFSDIDAAIQAAKQECLATGTNCEISITANQCQGFIWPDKCTEVEGTSTEVTLCIKDGEVTVDYNPCHAVGISCYNPSSSWQCEITDDNGDIKLVEQFCCGQFQGFGNWHYPGLPCPGYEENSCLEDQLCTEIQEQSGDTRTCNVQENGQIVEKDQICCKEQRAPSPGEPLEYDYVWRNLGECFG